MGGRARAVGQDDAGLHSCHACTDSVERSLDDDGANVKCFDAPDAALCVFSNLITDCYDIVDPLVFARGQVSRDEE